MHEFPVVHPIPDKNDTNRPFGSGGPLKEISNCSFGMFVWSVKDRDFNFFWHPCREVIADRLWTIARLPLQKKQGKDCYFMFSWNSNYFHDLNKNDPQDIPMNIARWFWYIEGHMGWHDRTMICRSKANNVVHVYLSPGWVQNQIMISLATVIARTGPYCRPGRSMDSMLELDYLSGTRLAFYRVLAGYQHYTGPSDATGWYNVTKPLLTPRQVNARFISRSLVEKKAEEIKSMPRPTGHSTKLTDLEAWHSACDYFNRLGYLASKED